MLPLGLAAVLALAGPGSAAPDGALPAYSPTEDMSCAAWAAFSAGSTDDDTVGEGFGYAMNYFLGRYEAATGGGDFTSALDAALAKLTSSQDDFDKVEAMCLPRWQAYLDRLDSWQGESETRPASQSSRVS